VDKENVTRAALPDRLLLLSLIVERLDAGARHRQRGPFSAALTNRGLYVDQAAAVHAALPELQELYFVVGFDKIAQIVDPRYYDDRDGALDRLFTSASFLVAPRAEHTVAALDALFDQPENRRYRSRVHPLPLPPAHAAASSTEIRARAARGLALPADLPPESATFVAEAGPYSPPEQRASGESVDRYGTRLVLIERLLAQGSTLTPDDVRRTYTAEVSR
jgi:nicotinic acid mononucleotide adenylyltransferase